VQQAPGQVVKTAVAVLVNSSSVKSSQLPSIKSLVQTAAGLDLATGDSIVVTALPFSPAAQQAATKAPTMVSKLQGFAPDIGLLLLIALFFFLALRSSKKRRPIFEEIPMHQFGGALSPIDVDTGELPAVTPLVSGMLSQAASPVTREVDAYINSSPEEVAQVMRAWSQERSARSAS
jgi:flagellar biosynthesis/type III secretory pathway M-ring protein FliF/YscJ